MDSLLVYSVASTALVGTMAYQAYLQRRQFYPTVRATHAQRAALWPCALTLALGRAARR